MNEKITKDICQEIQKGNVLAFEKLFFAYFKNVKYFIAGFVKSNDDAQELAQDVFLRVWENRNSFDSDRNINAFIYTMAKNHALNFIKHRQVQDKYITHQINFSESSYDIEQDYFAKEIDLLISMTVETMPERRREIYKMSRNEGLSNQEIALRLNISKKTVENHLTTALSEIRRVILLFVSLFT